MSGVLDPPARGSLVTSWRGPWSSSTTYAAGDLVSYVDPSDGAQDTWLAKAANTGVTPGSDATKWDFFTSAGANGAASTVAGPATPQPLIFQQVGAATVQASDPWYPPFAVTLSRVVTVDATGVTPTTGDVACDVKANGTSIFATAGDRPKIVSGSRVGQNSSAALGISGVAALTPITFEITAVGAAGSTPADPTVGTAGTYNSAAAAVTSFNLPIPATGQYAAGDLLVCVIASGSPATALPSGWTRLGGTAQDAAPTFYLDVLYKTAVATESATQAVTLSAGAPVSAATIAVHSGATSSPFDLNPSASVVDAAATSMASPSGTTTAAAEMALILYATRFTAGGSSNLATSGSITEAADLVTSRTGTNTNIGLTLAYVFVPSTATVPAYTATSGTACRSISKLVTVKKATGGGSPGTDIRCVLHYAQVS